MRKDPLIIPEFELKHANSTYEMYTFNTNTMENEKKSSSELSNEVKSLQGKILLLETELEARGELINELKKTIGELRECLKSKSDGQA